MKSFPAVCVGVVLCVSSCCVAAIAQNATAEKYSQQQLVQMAQPFVQEATKGNGTVSKILEKYPDHYTMLVYRNQDGVAEWHREFADIFVMVDGSAALVSGGEIVNPKPSGDGEIRGTSVAGSRMELVKGDVVHIAAGVPHQVLVPAHGSVTYFVIKVKTAK
jgi:mannose-6-phosphate isomerase-like protein (cupin superfamily)